MFRDASRTVRQPAEAPHRNVPAHYYLAVGASFAWFVVVGWLAYADDVDTVFGLMLATVFATVIVALPAILARAGRGRIDPAEGGSALGWLRGQFETLTGRLPAREALVQILLPITAAAIGFTVIAAELVFVRAGS